MKKKVIAIVAALFLTVGSAFSQVILTDEDVNHNRAQGTTPENFGVMVAGQGLDIDQYKYTPLGSGVLLLAGLGAAYLIKKKRQ